MLDAFLKRNAELLGRHFVDLKIDAVRMRHGEAVARELRGSDEGSVPWSVILDAQGGKLMSSDAADGNIGYPVKDAEIAHFMLMLQKSAANISADDVRALEEDLKAYQKERQDRAG